MDPKLMLTSKTDNWATPKDLYKKLDEEFNFNFDPCPLKSENNISMFFDWKERVFVNPPYSNIEPFLNKAFLEVQKGNSKVVVLLVPSRTEVKWFHKYIWDEEKHKTKKGVEIRFIKGRLKFGDSKTPAPFSSMIIILRGAL